MSEKVGELLRAGLDILYDFCPRDEDAYLCRKSEEYDDGICTRCWEQYLFQTANK
jgi:hypothetical protein